MCEVGKGGGGREGGISCLFCQLLDKCFLIINYETYLSIYDRKSS